SQMFRLPTRCQEARNSVRLGLPPCRAVVAPVRSASSGCRRGADGSCRPGSPEVARRAFVTAIAARPGVRQRMSPSDAHGAGTRCRVVLPWKTQTRKGSPAMLESLKPFYNRSSLLGEQLVMDGLLTQEQLQEALVRQAQSKKRLGETILQMGAVPAAL